MQELLPIGSILEKEGSRIIILGYQIHPESLDILYKCAQYPFGYINEEEAFFINSEMNFNILHTGYETEQFHTTIALINEIKAAYQKYGADNVNKMIEAITEEIEKDSKQGDKDE